MKMKHGLRFPNMCKKALPARAALRLAAVLCLLAALLLTGCGAKGSAPEEADPAATPAATHTLPGPEEQKALLEARRDRWAFADPYDSPWFYTFTDLDHNGRLEVIAASTQGSGVFTTAHYWELTPDFTDIVNLYHANVEVEGPDDWPEIITDQLTCYYDAAADRYYYTAENLTKSGYAHQYFSWNALCLKDGVAEWELLASKSVDYDEEGAEHVECQDAAGNPITQMEYDSAAASRFSDCTRSELGLTWTRVEIPFGDTAATVPAEPTGAETPTESIGTPTFSITKNPSSEAISVGGNTWFIAHADNGVAPVWYLQSPDGQSYALDDAMALHPGLSLEVLPQDTLAVSNVPLSVNGWAVVARFDGEGGSLFTEPATLYVGDFVSAYSGVIQKYKEAYESGSHDGAYAAEHDLSEIIGYSEHVGYALKDLDKDGVPEMIIAGIGTDDFSGGMIFEIYTLSENTPVRCLQSWARNRYYLRNDNRILNEGSSGAAFSSVCLYKLDKGTLVPIEAIITYFPGDSRDGCYHQVGHSDFEPSQDDIPISMEEYTATWEDWKSNCYTPPLTQIA